MKKSIFKAFNWLKDAGLKALVILLLVVAGFYVYAQIDWPTGEPNPTTGVVGMFVGASSDGYGDNAFRGYDQVNGMCETAHEGSHICTPDEMMNSYNHGTTAAPIFNYVDTPNLWVNNGPPGFTASANDCKGWTATARGSESDPNFGAMWIFSKGAGGLTPCATGKKFACCK